MLKQMNALESYTNELRKGSIPHISLFYGEEHYLVSYAATKVVNVLLPEPLQGINYHTWDGERRDFSAFVEAMTNYSFLTDRKVLLVSGGEVLLGKNATKSLAKRFEHFLKHGMPDSNLVIIACHGAVDKRSSLFKFLKKAAFCLEFPEYKTYDPGDPQKDETYQFVNKMLSPYQITIEPQAFKELRQRVPNNLWALSREVEKLINYVDDKKRITFSDVKMVTPRNPEEQIFALTDAISTRQLQAALGIFNDLTRGTANVMPVHYLLYRHFHDLLMVRQFKKEFLNGSLPRDFSYGALSRRHLPQWKARLTELKDSSWDFLLKRHAFVVHKLFVASHRFSDAILLWALKELSDLEYKIKSTTINHKVSLELILTGICHR